MAEKKEAPKQKKPKQFLSVTRHQVGTRIKEHGDIFVGDKAPSDWYLPMGKGDTSLDVLRAECKRLNVKYDESWPERKLIDAIRVKRNQIKYG